MFGNSVATLSDNLFEAFCLYKWHLLKMCTAVINTTVVDSCPDLYMCE
jgi:hypothetical protein